MLRTRGFSRCNSALAWLLCVLAWGCNAAVTPTAAPDAALGDMHSMPVPVTVPEPISLSLQVTDVDNKPIPGALVESNQSAARQTDSDGRVLFEGLSSGKLIYTVTAAGHAPRVGTADLEMTAQVRDDLRLHPVAVYPGTADEATQVAPDNVTIQIPADALKVKGDDNDKVVTGQYTIEYATYDPSKASWEERPGPLVTIGPEGAPQNWALTLAFSLTLRQNGQTLDLIPGKTIQIEYVLDASTCNVLRPDGKDTEVPLFSISEGEDVDWQLEEDKAEVRAAATSDGTCSLHITLTHLSWWAVGARYTQTHCFDVILVDANGDPVPNVKVAATGNVATGTFTYDEAFTGADGMGCVETEEGGTVGIVIGPAAAPLWTASHTGSGPAASCEANRSACQAVEVILAEPIVCVPGAYRTQNCGYTGPAGTEGVGACRAGRDYCNATGTAYLGCQGQVAPRDEICATSADEDCDGNSTCDASLTIAPKRLVAGSGHTCALLDNDALQCWGRNDVGQLGLGDKDDRGDQPNEMGADLPVVDLGIDLGSTAIALARGSYHGCALLDNGDCKCWGRNEDGQLGLGDTEARGDDPEEMGTDLPKVDLGHDRMATAVATSSRHTCALLANGALKCWGWNERGQLGLGDNHNRGDGPGEMGDALPVIDLGTGRTAVDLAAGYFHTCALLDTGALKCWGEADQGQLGLEDFERRGDDTEEMGDNLPAIDFGPDRTVVSLTTGSSHMCVLLDNGDLKCWGWNEYGQLGLGDINNRGDEPGEMGANLPAIDLGSNGTAVALAAGYDHTCALLDTGALKCWGRNHLGQLGLEDTDDRGDEPGEMGDSLPEVQLGLGRTAVDLTAGFRHTCVRLDTGARKCWGVNYTGQLGLGDTSHRGNETGEMGDNLPQVELDEAP